MTEFEAYKMYLALKAHFQTDDYDVFKMHGRIRASRKSFNGLGKEFAFRRLIKVYDTEDTVCNFMVANFIQGNHWGGVFDTTAAKEFMAWQRRNQSLSYTFEQDLNRLFTEAAEDDVADVFAFDAGTHPYILKAFMRRAITPETLVILDKLTNWVANCQLTDTDPVWRDIRRLIVKYKPFVKINLDKFQTIYDRIR
jgi:hypothetical protein